jgi:hypothetical protein
MRQQHVLKLADLERLNTWMRKPATLTDDERIV